MKIIITFPLVCHLLAGCVPMPQVVQPLRLYGLSDGRKLEFVLRPLAREHGLIVSSRDQTEQFEGEYVIYDRYSDEYARPLPRWTSELSGATGEKSEPDQHRPKKEESASETPSLPEMYGYGKYTAVRPVGTGTIVGKNGKVIEIVFYHISTDMKTGDGIARDNSGQYYRVYFSTEE